MIFENSIRNGGLIVDMRMPKCCDDCDANYDSCACGISGAAWFRNPRYKEFDPSKERLPDCPIKGVLPDEHGDLIDRDKAIFEMCEGLAPKGYRTWAKRYLKSEKINPTVIKAERKDDGKSC